MKTVLEELIRHKPGISTTQLYEGARGVPGLLRNGMTVSSFEAALWGLREKGYRVTNKQWYPKGHQADPKRNGPKKEDPRQTRMDW